MKTLKRAIQMGPQASVSHPALRLSFLQPHAVNQLLACGHVRSTAVSADVLM